MPGHRTEGLGLRFFLDMEGHIEDEKVAAAIERLRQDCMFLKVLGSYPKSG